MTQIIVSNTPKNLTGNEMNMNLVSIVVPTYNRAYIISNCIRSLLRQTYLLFEIIVIDDCSTDNTSEVVRSFNDPRVRYYIQPSNAGAQAARNRGILEAHGEWIAFQDSDDEWLPDKLEKQIAALEKVNFAPMTVVHTDCFRQECGSKKCSVWKLPVVEGSDVFSQLLRSPGPVFPSILTSKKALETIDHLDEQVPSYQEWDTVIRLARICQFIHLRTPLFIYNLHNGETISKNIQRSIEGYQYVIDKFRNDILFFCGPDILNYHLINNARIAVKYSYYKEAEIILAKTTNNSFATNIFVLISRIKACQKTAFVLFDYIRVARRLFNRLTS